jgi:TP901 family phage tail tape measure protein
MATGRKISIIVDEQGANRVAKSLNKVNTVGDKVRASFKRLTAGIGAFTKKALIATAAITGLVYGASRFARTVFTPFMGLEYTMARVRVAEGATIEQTKALTEVASQLGRDTLYSASQAAEGMLFLAKAGLDVKQTMEAIPGVLQAAIVEDLDLGTAADIVTGLLNEFALSADKAGIAADVLAKGSNLAKTNMPEMSEALKYFGATAHEMGYDIQHAVAMLDVLAGKMIRGSMAGTAMRQSMLLFQKVQAAGTFITKAQTDAIRRLGLDAGKLAKQIKSGDLTFMQFLSTLKKAGATTGDFASIFEQRAAVAVNALAEAAETSFPKYVDELNDAVGFTKEAGDVLETTLAGQVKQIKSSWETMTNALATTFAPGLRDFLQFELRPWTNDVTKAWETGGDTWQEKLKNVWRDKLLPVVKSGMQDITEAIASFGPVIAQTLGMAVIPGIKAMIVGIGMGFDTAIWEMMKSTVALPGEINAALARERERAEASGTPFNWDDVLPARGPRTPATLSPEEAALLQQRMAIVAGLPGSVTLPPGSLPLPGASLGAPNRIDALEKAVTENTDAVNDNTVVTDDFTRTASEQRRYEYRDLIESRKHRGITNITPTSDIQNVVNEFMGKAGNQMLGSLEGTLMSAVTDPITGALDKYLGPTSTRIGELADRVFHMFDFPMSGLNTALGWLVDLLGGPSYTQGRYTYAGAYAGGGDTGGLSASSAVHVGEINVYGGPEETGTAVVDQIAEYEALTTHQMARSLKRGMLKREATER